MSSILGLILDTNIKSWVILEKKYPKIKFKSFLEKLLLFLNSFKILNEKNKYIVIGNNQFKTEFIYPNQNEKEEEEKKSFEEFVDSVQKHLFTTQKLAKKSQEKQPEKSLLSQALSRSLCYLNSEIQKDLEKDKIPKFLKQKNIIKSILTRNKLENEQKNTEEKKTGNISNQQEKTGRNDEIKTDFLAIQPRIFVIQISSDSPSQYIPLMNCVFAAQKSQIPIDVLMLSSQDSQFLQQAAKLTNGIYFRPEIFDESQIFKLMISTYLIDSNSRSNFLFPEPININNSATCFSSGKNIELGFVCSACFSIFSQFYPICPTCKSKISILKPFSKIIEDENENENEIENEKEK
ncbi:transcription initiation factor iih tfiih polypeptide 3-related [Anaeramoeba ignava]|uniref:Transcription initiation factor iih tfiih polypeptide 3-related n=1 Tax=Anaeramoeba ignava TaxID=1746090 RepID=A0A9Q0LCN6_ANAIG|nr:transcription initiation factor iih tfiih polypeptide 3-related [Anaeramoeba ignava]